MPVSRIDFRPNNFSGSPIEVNAIEAVPPTSAAAIAFDAGSEIDAPGGVYTAGIYVKAVTQAVTWSVKGRSKVGSIVGDLIEIATGTQAAGGSSFTVIDLTTGVFLPDEFQVHWTAPSGAGTCQLVFKLG